MTSSAKAEGRFDKEDFVFDADVGEYKCPAGRRLIWRCSSEERAHIGCYFNNAAGTAQIVQYRQRQASK